jgi:hypothetical protein
MATTSSSGQNKKIETLDEFTAVRTAVFERQKQIIALRKENPLSSGAFSMERVELQSVNEDLESAYDKDLNIKRALLISGFVTLCQKKAFPDAESELDAENFIVRQSDLIMKAAINKEYITAKSGMNLSDAFVAQSKNILEIIQIKNETYGKETTLSSTLN